MSNENPTSSVDKPTDAASPANSSEQVTIPGMETPESEKGKVKGLLDALGVLKEQLQTELNVSLSAEDNKFCVCFKGLEEKILSFTENQQETEASNVIDDVLTQDDIQNKQAKEKLNGLEDELSKKREELKKTNDEFERKKSKWKDIKNNHKMHTTKMEEKIAKRDKLIEEQDKLLDEKGSHIQKLKDEIEDLKEKVRTVEAELEQAKEDSKKGNDTKKLINEIEARNNKIQYLQEKVTTVEAELEQVKEDAKKKVEEAEVAFKAKENHIQTLEHQLSKLEIEIDRNLWKGKCEGLLDKSQDVKQCVAALRDAIHKIPNPENRQPSYDSSVPTSQATSCRSTDLDPDDSESDLD